MSGSARSAPRAAPEAAPRDTSLRLLGPLRLTVDGEDRTPRSPTARAVLAVLALRAGQTVELTELVRRVWGDPAPRTAHASARNVVSRLRRLLAGAAGVALDTHGRGYRLTLAPDASDVPEFERQVEIGRGWRRADRPDRAAESLRSALSTTSGPVLPELRLDGHAWPEMDTLDGLRLRAVEELLDADLAGGRHRELVAPLQCLVREHPRRPELHRLRIVALARSGRRAEATAAHRDARAALPVGVADHAWAGLDRALADVLDDRERPRQLSGPPRAAPVRRSDVGGVTRIPRLTPGTGMRELAHQVRGVSVLCARNATPGPPEVSEQLAALVASHGGSVQIPVDDVLVAYFGLSDDGPGRREPARDRAVACAMALRDTTAEPAPPDLSGSLRGPADPAPPAVVVGTGTVMYIVRECPDDGLVTWVAGEVVTRCAEALRHVPQGTVVVA